MANESTAFQKEVVYLFVSHLKQTDNDLLKVQQGVHVGKKEMVFNKVSFAK